MSLKVMHIVFVTASSLLCFVFGGWSVHAYRVGRGEVNLALGLPAFAIGVGLIVYGFWFWRKITTREEEDRRRRKILGRVPVLLGVWVLGTRAASACSVCYGEAAGPMIDGARLGVFLLFGLVGAVQLAFVLFFIHLWRRARVFEQRETAP